MRALVIALLCAFLVAPLATRAAQEPAADLGVADRAAIRSVIRAQMNAFRVDDAERAFAFASPGIQARYGDAGTFLRAVAAAYLPVYRPQAVLFQDVVSIDGQPAQRVLVQAPDGETVLAVYPMERQPDGSWRIDGCFLLEADARML